MHEPFREPSSHLYEQCKHSGLAQTVAELRMLQMSGCGLRGALHFRAPPCPRCAGFTQLGAIPCCRALALLSSVL